MQNDPASFAIEQQILSAPVDGADHAPGHPAQEIARYGPSKRAIAHHHAGNAPALHMLSKPAACGLDLREFRHAERLLLCDHVGIEQTLTCVDAEVVAQLVVGA